MRTLGRFTAAAVVAMTAGTMSWAPNAFAQTSPTPKPGAKDVIPEKQAPPLATGRSDSLSTTLDKNDGVIKPKTNVDPGMAVPAPAVPHTTPVIPPSATGGNNAK